MFTIWGKVIRDNKILNEMTVTNDSDDTRTHKVFGALNEMCYKFDLSRPLWLDKNIRDFKNFSKTRFTQDSFIDTIEFDYLEIQILEED